MELNFFVEREAFARRRGLAVQGLMNRHLSQSHESVWKGGREMYSITVEKQVTLGFLCKKSANYFLFKEQKH